MSGTLAIVGAGPGLAMGIARVFGARGFRVGLIARSQAGLRARLGELSANGIEAAAAVADVRVPDQLRAGLDELVDRLGPVDVLEYGPDPRSAGVSDAMSTTAESATAQFELIVRGALVAAQHVLPHMVAQGHGALLMTTGVSSTIGMPMLGNVGIAMAGLRNWVHAVAPELGARGVYVGTVTIATTVGVAAGQADPDAVGRLYYDMYTRRDRTESVVGDVEQVRALVARYVAERTAGSS